MEILKKIKNLGDITKFSWAEMVSDNSGKTSASSVGGFVLTIVGAFLAIYASIVKTPELITLATNIAMYGAGLLGLHGVMNGNSIETITKEPEQVTPDTPSE